VRNLANFRPVSNDEGELIALGANLASHGVFGSPLYQGFFGADQHLLWTLPLQPVLDALAFRVLGVDVAVARWISALAAVGVLWTVGWVAFRWYGLGTALLCEVLLVAWRTDLTSTLAGLPLLAVARSARYDVLAVAFIWLTIALLDELLRRPRPGIAVLVGLSAGLASLSQFFGAFVLPLLALCWWWIRDQRAARTTLTGMLLGIAVVIVPWMAFVGVHFDDFQHQLSVYGTRGDFLTPGFYLSNAASEPARFANLARDPAAELDGPAAFASEISRWTLLAGVWLAVAYIVVRAVRGNTYGDRLLLATFIVFGGLLLLLDGTKTPLYAVVLVPSICVAMAASAVAAVRWIASARRPGWLRWGGGGVAALVLLSILAEGARAIQFDLMESTQVSDYRAMGRQLAATLDDDGLIFGPERWWLPLRNHPYQSLRSIWFQWTAAQREGHTAPDFVTWVDRFQPTYVVVNNNVRDDVLDFSPILQQQFWSFLENCTEEVDTVDDRTYFPSVIYRVRQPRPPGCSGQTPQVSLMARAGQRDSPSNFAAGQPLTRRRRQGLCRTGPRTLAASERLSYNSRPADEEC
jgi:hypothetical protein